MNIQKFIKEQLTNVSDFIYIQNIKTQGIKYLYNCFKNNYENDKNLIDTYSLIYLSSETFDILFNNESIYENFFIINEQDYFIQLIINNDSFITKLILLEDDLYIKFLKNKLLKNIIQIIFTLPIKKKIKIYKNLFEINYFCNYIFNESSYWNSTEDTIIGNIINDIVLNDKYLRNIGIIINFFYLMIDKLEIGNKILNWFDNIISKNIDYKKTLNLLVINNNLSSLNFLNKIVIFNMELYKNYKILNSNEIDIDIFYDIKHTIWWNKSDRDINFEWKLNENLPIVYSFNTKMFVYTHQLLELSIIPSIEKFNLLNKEKIRLNNLIENSLLEFENYPILKKIYLDKLKEDYNNIIIDIYKIIVILDNKYLLDSILYFLNNTSKIILKNKCIPNKFIETFTIILNYYENIIKQFIVRDNIINLLELILDIINDKFQNTKIYIKNNLIIFLSYNNDIIFDNFKNNINKLKYYIEGLIKFYINISKNNEEIEIYNVRNNINYILIYFLTYYNNQKNIILNLTDFNHLFFLMITNTNSYFEETIYFIKKLEDSLEKTSLISKLLQFSTFLNYGLEFISKIIDEFYNEISRSKVNMEKLANFINFWNITLIKNSNIKMFDFKKYNINFKWKILYDITKMIYITFNNNKLFIKYMKNDNLFFDEAIFSNFNLSFQEDNKLNILVDKIKKSKKKSKKYINEFPNEFCDPLLYVPIKEPIILPESKVFMDFSSISNHLLNNEFDPFNRTKLTIKELIEFNLLPENIEKIELFKNKIAKWKMENRK